MARPTLKDVAAQSGYALRTVKKVMSGDPTVRDQTREAVMQAAASLSYTPNRAASALGKQKQVNLAVVYSKPSEIYFSDLERGFRRCAGELFDYGLNLQYFTTREPGWEAQRSILDGLLNRNDIDGVIVQPVSANKLDPSIDALVQRGKPVVTVGSDAPESLRMCFVGCDAVRSGRIAGQLMAAYMGRRGSIFIVSDQSDQEQARKWADGLTARIQGSDPGIKFRVPTASEASLPTSILIRHLVQSGQIDGIFCTSGNNTIETAEILRELNAANITLAGFDLSPASAALMKDGWIDVLLDQKPDVHAYEAAKLLFYHIADGICSDSVYTLPIYLHTSECLPVSD